MSNEGTKKEVLERHMDRVGWLQPHNHTLAEVLPDVVDAKSQLYNELLGKAVHLDLKTKALIHVALSAARFAQGTQQHVKNAMKHGATREEIVEAFSLTLVTFGGQACRWGIDALDAVEGNKRVVDDSRL